MGERLKLNEASGNVVSFDTNLERKLESLKINIEPIQEGSGDPSPDNVRPIRGWTGATIHTCNANLWDNAWFATENNPMTLITDPTDDFYGYYGGYMARWQNNYSLDSGGEMGVAKNIGRVRITATFGTPSTFSQTFRINAKYDDGTIGTTGNNTAPAGGSITVTFITAINKNCVGFNLGTISGINTYGYIKDVTVTQYIDEEDYIPPENNAYPITFPSAAGTVYGGTLDVTTGVLTVDKASVLLDGTQNIAIANWGAQSDVVGWLYSASVAPGYKVTSGTALADIKCDVLPTVEFNPIKFANKIGIALSNSDAAYSIAVMQADKTLTTKTAINEWLQQNPMQVVYGLSTPQTYQLTPTEITTLLGANTIYANCGEIEVKWCDEELVQPTKTRNLTLENCKEGPIDSFVVVANNSYKSGSPTPTNENFYYEMTDIGFTIGSFENEVPLIPDNYTPVTASGATLNYLGDGVYFLDGTTTGFGTYDVPLKSFTFDINKKYIGNLEILNIEQSKLLFGISLAGSDNTGTVATWRNLKTDMKSTFLINLSTSMLFNLTLRFIVSAGYSNIKFKFKIFEIDSNKICSPDISAISKPIYHFSYDAMTGVLTLPRNTKTLTADDLIEVGTSDSGVQYAITTDILDIKPNSEVTGNRHYWENPGNNNTMKSEDKHVIIYDNRFTDLATAKELIGGTIVYYDLDTPETYQLESYPVTLQKGTNVFCGNDTYSQLSIKYREEIKESILNLRRRSFAWDYKTYIASHPAVLQKLCSTGKASNYFKIGDEIIIPWTDNGGNTPIEYQYPFVVTHFGDVYDENGNLHENGMWLMAKYATPRGTLFDAAESTTVNLAEEPNALEGWYYWGVDGSDYTELKLNTGDTIPTTHASVVKCGINNVGALRYGYNRWKDSAYRQWLNSDAAKNEGWWTEQHMGDLPLAAAQLNLPGWLDGFTDEWKAIFKPVKVDTACNTVTDGGVIDTTYDTFFLPSLEQMYGAPQAVGVEGDYWEYWKEETGLDAPTNGSSSNTNEARKIPSIANPTGSAVYCRLRSAYRGSAGNVWYVYAAGYLGSSGAYVSYRALPSCVIY